MSSSRTGRPAAWARSMAVPTILRRCILRCRMPRQPMALRYGRSISRPSGVIRAGGFRRRNRAIRPESKPVRQPVRTPLLRPAQRAEAERVAPRRKSVFAENRPGGRRSASCSRRVWPRWSAASNSRGAFRFVGEGVVEEVVHLAETPLAARARGRSRARSPSRISKCLIGEDSRSKNCRCGPRRTTASDPAASTSVGVRIAPASASKPGGSVVQIEQDAHADLARDLRRRRRSGAPRPGSWVRSRPPT